MNEINNVTHASILEQINQRTEKQGKDSGESDFLKLLVAQLNNQNPLQPQENGEFLSQLAQFSTVEGIEKMNLMMKQLSTGMLSNQALQATALVGRSVLVPSDVGHLQSGSALTGAVDVPVNTSNLTLSIFDESGALVRRLPMGAQDSGDVRFSWDGFNQNGAPLPSGRYRIMADAYIDGEQQQLDAQVNANVDSVTTGGQSGGVILNLEGALGSVALNDVIQIN